MSVHVYIPTPFRRATNNQDRVALDAPDVRRCSIELEEHFGGLKGLVRNEQRRGAPPREHLRQQRGIDALQGLETPLRDGDEVSIIPALAGGALPGRDASSESRRRPSVGARMTLMPVAR